MRSVPAFLAILCLSATEASAAVPDMICYAERGAAGPDGQSQAATDVFRIAAGRLFHRWSEREEYFYNHIGEIGRGRYVSGHMLVVLNDELTRGYVVIAGTYDWRVAYIRCSRT